MKYLILVLAIFTLFSCSRKEYSCACSTINSTTGEVSSIKAVSRARAEKKCKNRENNITGSSPTDTTTCELW